MFIHSGEFEFPSDLGRGQPSPTLPLAATPPREIQIFSPSDGSNVTLNIYVPIL